MQHEAFPTFKNTTEVAAFVKAQGDGENWQETIIRVGPEDFPPGAPIKRDMKVFEETFHHADIMLWLASQYSQSPSGLFATQFEQKLDAAGNRCFNEPHQCGRWEFLEAELRKEDPDGKIAALQAYSDKTLLNMKGATAHPIRCVLVF